MYRCGEEKLSRRLEMYVPASQRDRDRMRWCCPPPRLPLASLNYIAPTGRSWNCLAGKLGASLNKARRLVHREDTENVLSKLARFHLPTAQTLADPLAALVRFEVTAPALENLRAIFRDCDHIPAAYWTRRRHGFHLQSL
jgi:hypothetical protein